MCAAIISNIPFILVINKNILNRRAPAVKYDHTASSGGVMTYTQSVITSARCRQRYAKFR